MKSKNSVAATVDEYVLVEYCILAALYFLGIKVRFTLEVTSIGRENLEIILRSDDSHLYKRAQDFIAF